MANRKGTQDFIISYINKLTEPDTTNGEMYQSLFDLMDDDAFGEFMAKLESGEVRLSITSPNFGKAKLDTVRNMEIAKELGHEFFQRIWVPSENGNPTYLTPVPYMVVDLPVKRQAQVLSKKIQIPEDNNSVDDFTGQPTGKSKGSRISYPELQVLAAIGLNEGLTEMMKFRGGDEKGFNAMNTIIDRTGTVSLKSIEKYASGVKSTHTLKSFLTSCHLKNTL